MTITDEQLNDLVNGQTNERLKFVAREVVYELRQLRAECHGRRFDPNLVEEIGTLRAEIEQLRRIAEIAHRVVSRGIHRRQDHREVMLRSVELLPNDIEILGKLAEVLDLRAKQAAFAEVSRG